MAQQMTAEHNTSLSAGAADVLGLSTAHLRRRRLLGRICRHGLSVRWWPSLKHTAPGETEGQGDSAGMPDACRAQPSHGAVAHLIGLLRGRRPIRLGRSIGRALGCNSLPALCLLSRHRSSAQPGVQHSTRSLFLDVPGAACWRAAARLLRCACESARQTGAWRPAWCPGSGHSDS